MWDESRPSHQVPIAVPCLAVLGCRGPGFLDGDQPALAPVCCARACVFVCVCARARAALASDRARRGGRPCMESSWISAFENSNQPENLFKVGVELIFSQLAATFEGDYWN